MAPLFASDATALGLDTVTDEDDMNESIRNVPLLPPLAAPDIVRKCPTEAADIPVSPVIVASPAFTVVILSVEPVCPANAAPRKFGSSVNVIDDDCNSDPAMSKA